MLNTVTIDALSASEDDPTLRFPDKDPADAVPIRFDFRSLMIKLGAINEGVPDAISGTPIISASPPDLVFSPLSLSAYAAIYTVSGGVVNGLTINDYTISFEITTGLGFTIRRNVFMKVYPLSSNQSNGPPYTIVVTGASGTGITSIASPDINGDAIVTLTDGTTQLINFSTALSGLFANFPLSDPQVPGAPYWNGDFLSKSEGVISP